VKRHDAGECRPPDPRVFHVMGEYAARLPPTLLVRLTYHNVFLQPGDTWRCACRRRWIFTPHGWRRRYPKYIGMAYGNEWTNDHLAGWEDAMHRALDNLGREVR
jgi:hypothetical protein